MESKMPKASAVKLDVDTICRYANHKGLSSSALTALLQVLITPIGLEQSSQNALLKSLYPSSRVPNSIVHIIVYSLGTEKQKPSSITQQGLLRWLVMVLGLLQNPAILSRLYSVLFNLLDVLYLRAHLCHLLAKITRKKHIKPFRTEMLQQLGDGITKEANLIKLMNVFEYLAPGNLELRKAKLPIIFSHPDPQWADTLRTIWLRNAVFLPPEALSSENTKVGCPSEDMRRGSGEAGRSDEVSNLEDVDNIVKDLEKLQILHLTQHDLGDRLSQQYIMLRPQELNNKQVDECLNLLFARQKDRIEEGEYLEQDLLQCLLAYTRYTKGSLFPSSPSTSANTQTPLDLHPNILAPLETALIDSTTNSLVTVLTFYTHLLTHWTPHLLFLPLNHPPSPEHTSTLTSLVEHTSLLALTILVHAPSPTQTTVSTILSHFESQIPLIQPLLSLPLPPPQSRLVYALLFTSPSLSTTSRVSALLAGFKQAYEQCSPATTDQATMPPPVPYRAPADIHTLNGELMDTCNLLLRSRAFNTSDAHAAGCSLNPALVAALGQYTASLSPSLDLAHLFSLSHHLGLAGLSIAAFRELEDGADIKHAGPVTQRSLALLAREGGIKLGWRDYRVHVLKRLDEVGVCGMVDLGRATMKGLMGGEGKGAGARESDVSKVTQ
ncbi:MAG: hypothetical protein Q9163_004324 [Psora crenata]